MKVLMQAVTAAALVFMLAAGPALATGAIAVDDEVGLSASEVGFGWATGAPDRKEAEHRAMKACREHGNDSCKVVVWFEGCGAYAASKEHAGSGYGSTREIAKREALDECGTEHCRIVVAECDE